MAYELRKKRNNYEKILKHEKKVLVLSIFFVLVLLISSSYALLTNFDTIDNAITFQTGNLNMTVTNLGESITLTELNGKLPESDELGLQNAEPIILTLTNTGTMLIEGYEVKLVDENGANISTLDESYIKYAISLDNGVTYSIPNKLTMTENVIYTGYNLDVNKSKTIYLKVWIDENAGNNALGKEYYGSIEVALYQKMEEIEVNIVSVVYKDSVSTDPDDSEIITARKNSLKSNVVLSPTDSDSSITYTVTVYNDTSENYMFMGTIFDELYSNENIIFETTLEMEDAVLSKSSLTFDVTFKYAPGVTPTNDINTLLSQIDFIFEPAVIKETLSGIEFNYLVKNGEYAPEGDVYEYYNVDANRLVNKTVKKIIFGKLSDYETKVSNLEAEPIDIYRTGSISLYREQIDSEMFNIYILSDSGKFVLNEKSSWMFDKLYELEEIVNLHLLNTSNAIEMRDMFCDCAKLKYVDLSNFDTSNVTNMIGMFARMYEIEYLDLTTFDTSNVELINQMFTNDTSLKKIYVSSKWDLSSVEEGTGLFTNCTELVGGNGTALTTTVDYTMAKVDTSSAIGYLTSGYKFATGIDFNHAIKNISQTDIDNWTLSTRYEDTSIKTITFGKTRDYQEIVSNYTYKAVDSDGSGVIRIYRVLNSDSSYSIYVLSDTATFIVNEDASWMFDKLIFLEEINNLNLLNTSNANNMRDMFCDCQYLKTIDLSNFNTINVESFEGMLARTYYLKTIDLSNFNTANTTNIKNMFALSVESETHESLANVTPALTTIYVSNSWVTTKMLETDVAFSNNVNLVGGNGTKFNSSNVSVSYARVDTSSTPGYFTLKN